MTNLKHNMFIQNIIGSNNDAEHNQCKYFREIICIISMNNSEHIHFQQKLTIKVI